MRPSTIRIFTAARVAALTAIALLAGSLVFVRLAPGPEQVTVPAGAKAGDLRLRPCSYQIESGNHPADCGTLVVPENRASPHSRLIALPLIRIRASAATGGGQGTGARTAQPIFALQGGPGLSNMHFVEPARFAGDHDVILLGYRGVDGSSILDCPEVSSALQHSTDVLRQDSLHAYSDAFRACAARLTASGVDLAGYGLAAQADDLEAARTALGYGPVDLISESAGTRLAMVYAWRYPSNVYRSVMIGVNPPGHFVWDPTVTDQQLAYYSQLCAQDASCRARTGDLAASMRDTSAHMPARWLGLRIKPGSVRVATFLGMPTAIAQQPPTAPMTIDSWLAAAHGDPSGLWFNSVLGDLVAPTSFVWGELASVGDVDSAAVRDYFGTAAEPDSIATAASTYLWGGGGLADAWPASPADAPYRTVRDTSVPTLLIGGTLDFATPPQGATADLLPHLSNGYQVVLSDLGHTADFWAYQPDAGRRLVGTFLDTGQVDRSLYRRATVDFTPSVSEPALAKYFAGALAGLALLMLFSLVWMAVRVRRAGPYRRVPGALLRCLAPVVFGLGGWCLGALVVFTALTGVPLGDVLLATVSIGLPIGIGVQLAWVNRDRSSRRHALGLAAAVAGALCGAWLGFQATGGPAALLTAVLGAIAGANLLLLALDLLGSSDPGAGRLASPL
jgi:pimeloyl-ACP methyl ester carboxylesterase